MSGRISVMEKKQLTRYTYNEMVINIKLQFEKPMSKAVAIAIKRENISQSIYGSGFVFMYCWTQIWTKLDIGD